jgi:prephenate dehydratase
VAAVREGRADLAMLPVENSTYGRVADIHHLLPDSGLHIVAEHFLRVHIALLAVPGARLADVRAAMSHTVLLGQCRDFLRAHGIERRTGARHRRLGRDGRAHRRPFARRPRLGPRRKDLRPRAARARDRGPGEQHHALSRHGAGGAAPTPGATAGRHDHLLRLPRAQHPRRALQGDGRLRDQRRQHGQARELHGEGHFTATQFYADIEGHPDEPAVARALEELAYFTSMLQILGVYRAHPYRQEQAAAEAGA